MLYYIKLYYIIIHCIILYYIVLYCIALYCIILYYIVLYYIVYIIYTSPIKFVWWIESSLNFHLFLVKRFKWTNSGLAGSTSIQIMFGVQTKPSSATFPHPQTGFLQAKTDK